jgi:hypothetical protein
MFVSLLVVALATSPSSDGPYDDSAEALTALIHSDWSAQEARLGRLPHAPEAIAAALGRSKLLVDDRRRRDELGTLTAEAARLAQLAARAEGAAALGDEQRLSLYREVRAFTRELALRNSLVASQPIVFMLRRRAVGYMLYEYLGWYYVHGSDPRNGYRNPRYPPPEPGGGVYLLEHPGHTLEVRELTAGLLPPGHFTTLATSFDARTLYFAFANPAGRDPLTLPGYLRAPVDPAAECHTFSIYALDVDGAGLRRLTSGPYDDFDPAPLPDGGIAFQSTRRGGKLRCGGGSPEQVNTLHRMDADGGKIRTLSFHETNEWHPSTLHDGRIVYTRWDYVDRNAAKFHGLWTCNPDGTQPSVLFGNSTTRPWACYQAKAIPGSRRILVVAGGHHANVGGTLVLLDPSRVALDPVTGEDYFEALEWLTPEVPFAESEGWPSSFFHSPWPLSEDYYLVAFSHDPLPGGYTGTHTDSETGLYYFDRFGNLELLFRREGISAVYPIPLVPRPVPPVRAGDVHPELDEEGEFLLADVRVSLLPLPADRPITALRVFQLLPKSRTDHAADPPISHAPESNARMLLGTVPVEEDGSAYFRAPARKPLYFQAVDASGRAVQGMRSAVYLQPGERHSCVGCHEPPGTLPPARQVLAANRPPSVITSGPAGSKPFGFPRLVQPVLDRHCVGCHDGTAGPDKGPLDLSGAAEGTFSVAYKSLRPFVQWPSYDAAATRPGELGADLSPLSAILTGEPHRRRVELPDEHLRILYLWLDAQVPFYGTYEENDLAAQRLGLPIPPPPLQ